MRKVDVEILPYSCLFFDGRHPLVSPSTNPFFSVRFVYSTLDQLIKARKGAAHSDSGSDKINQALSLDTA